MRSIYVILVVLVNTFAFSQKIYEGKVLDSHQFPISYADVVAIDSGDRMIESSMTDQEGNFKIKINEQDSIRIEISFVGFQTKVIFPSSANVGTVILKEQATELKEIAVVARKKLVEQKVDRLVFNASNSVASSNGNALDLLKVTPGVQIDQKNVIRIIGKSAARVLINDKMVQMSGEELTNYLEGISSDDIEKIEVITMPPSKYEAEGNSGLINIILKKAKENSWSNQTRATYIQKTYPTAVLGNTFNYSKNKWTIFSTLSLKKGSNRNTSKYFIDYPDELWEGKSTLKGETENILGTIGVDYQLSKMASVGVLYSGNYYENEAKDQRYVSLYSVNDKSFGSIKTEGKTTRNNKQNNLNFHYSQKLDTLGRNMSIDLNYFDYLDNRDRVFSSNRMGRIVNSQISNNTGIQKIKNYSAKIDFNYPIRWAELAFGGKITRTNTDNEMSFFDLTSGEAVLDKSKSNLFEYTENIQALYFEAVKNFNEKWQAKFGIRMENTQMKGESRELDRVDKKRYTEYFPTIYLNYNKDQSNTFNVSYSRRINRPSFHFLNPFKFYTDANSYTVGNPDLKFSISDIAGLKYIYKSNLITELFFERNKDSFSQVIDLDIKNNTQVYIYKNVGDTYFYGVGQTVIYHPFEWWNTTTMLSAFYFDIKINEAIKLAEFGVNKGWVSVLYTNQVFFLSKNKNLQAEIGFLARTRSYNDLETFDPTYTLDIGFRASLLNKSLQVTAKINDIFNTSLYKSTSYTKGIKQRYINDYDNRYFTLGLSYKFGNNKIAVKEHDKGNEDELNRIK